MNRKIVLAVLISVFFLLSFPQAQAQNKPPDWFELETRLLDIKAVFPNNSGFLGQGRITYGRGVLLAPDVAVTVYHVTTGMLCDIYVNNAAAPVLGFCESSDLLFLKIPTGDLASLKPCPAVKNGDEMMILRKEPQSGFEWHTAKVTACFAKPEFFCLESGYKVKGGDSGSPVFNRKGEFAGLVRAFTSGEPRYTIVVSAGTVFSRLPKK